VVVVGGARSNDALTAVLPLMTKAHVVCGPAAAHASPHPTNTDPAAGVAVSVSEVPVT
jgi:hypothetical protein